MTTLDKIKIFVMLSAFASSIFASSKGQRNYKFFKDQKTVIKNPFKLRDPFKRPFRRGARKAKKRFGGTLSGNTFSNVASIEGVALDKIKIVGVLLGENRRAIAKVDGKGNTTYVLKEGMKVGEDDAELRAILPGGIVLVEKIRNVYDQDEYLETIIPISEEN